MGIFHRSRLLWVLGAVFALGVIPSCDGDPVTGPAVNGPVDADIEWSIDAEAEGFIGLEEAGGVVVTVGGAGTYQLDGSTWNRVADGIDAHDISLGADGALFALRGRSLYRRDSATWMNVRTFGFSSQYATVPAVWAHGADQVFVITSEVDEYYYFTNNTLHQFNGTSWTALESFGFSSAVYDMWGTSPSNIYIACSDGLYHYDGDTVSRIDAAGSTAIRMITGTSEIDIFAIRSDQSILQFDGNAFSSLPTPTTKALTSARRIDGDLFVCGAEGTCYRRAGNAWQTITTGAVDHLSGVWGESAADIFTVGNGGILQLDDGVWRRSRGGAPVPLYDIWVASTGEVLVVGSQGAIEIRDAAGWRPIRPAGLAPEFSSIAGTSLDNLYAVGDGGAIIHYDGISWSPMSSGTSAGLTAVWAGDNTAVAVGGTTIIKLDNGAWAPMPGDIPQDIRLQDVWGASNGDLFAVGHFRFEYKGTILRYDGTSWRRVDEEARPRMFGVWGFAPDDVFAVGEAAPQDGTTRYWAGVIYHFDGSAWTRMHVNEDIPSLYALWGASPDNLVAVGGRGLTLYDGTSWTFESLAGYDGRGLNDISATAGGDVFALGTGAVVRFQFPR